MSCDLVLVGVGGQGVLTIADLLIRCAFEEDVPATYVPTKGMAQRGGSVKAEVRLGRERVGARIGEEQADLVVAMERSEGLRGLTFLRPGGTFLLYDDVWTPTGVVLGTDDDPTSEQVLAAIEAVAGDIVRVDPMDRPSLDGGLARANLFVLGAMIGRTRLGEILSSERVERTIASRWPQASAANVTAFRAGSGGG